MFQRLLGHGFFKMPDVFRKIHGSEIQRNAKGELKIERAGNIISKIILLFSKLPEDGNHEFNLSINAQGENEMWERSFKGFTLNSIQYTKNGKLYEKFGLKKFIFNVVRSDDTLIFNCKGFSFLFIPLPLFLSPNPHVIASAIDDSSWFIDVSIKFLGFSIYRYHGKLSIT